MTGGSRLDSESSNNCSILVLGDNKVELSWSEDLVTLAQGGERASEEHASGLSFIFESALVRLSFGVHSRS